MQRFNQILSALFLSVALTGCGGGADPLTTQGPANTAAQPGSGGEATQPGSDDEVEPQPRSGTSVFFSELVSETEDWKQPSSGPGVNVHVRYWALRRHDIETGETRTLRESRSWVIEWRDPDGNPKPEIGGERLDPRVIDGELYVDGLLADPETGESVRDKSGRLVRAPERERFTRREVIEQVTEVDESNVVRVLGERTYLVIEEVDTETGAPIREAARLLLASTAERDDALRKFDDLNENLVVDGDRVFLMNGQTDSKSEVLMVDAGEPEASVRTIRSVDLVGTRISGYRVVRDHALIVLEDGRTLYVDLVTGETRLLDFAAQAILPPADSTES